MPVKKSHKISSLPQVNNIHVPRRCAHISSLEAFVRYMAIKRGNPRICNKKETKTKSWF